METISVKGEEYVKASDIARELGYTADYVGQLCRGGKVDAKLVGRSWYVKEDSLRGHRKTRYRSSLSKTKEEIQKTIEKKRSEETASPRYFSRVSTGPSLSYEPDTSDILPSVERTRSQPKSESIKLKVHNSKDTANKPLRKSLTKRKSTSPHRISATANQLQSPVALNVKDEEETEETLQFRDRVQSKKPKARRGSFALITVAIVLLVGLGLAGAFVGLETSIAVSGDETLSTYALDFSPALEFIKNSYK